MKKGKDDVLSNILKGVWNILKNILDRIIVR